MVVLFSLAVLAVLFATASTRTLTSLQFQTAEVTAAKRFDGDVAALDALTTLGRPEGDQMAWGERMLRLQSTGGLVDLNTAAPELLERLLIGYDLSAPERAEALSAYRTWRRQSRRLQRVADFARVAGIDPARLPSLERLATVHSGRSTLSGEQAPLHLLTHLTGRQGERETLLSALPPEVLGPATAASFAVFDDAKRIGVIAFGTTRAQHRILTIN